MQDIALLLATVNLVFIFLLFVMEFLNNGLAVFSPFFEVRQSCVCIFCLSLNVVFVLPADPVWTVMTARFRLPAGRTYNVRASELARDRQHTEVVCNILLLDNTVQAFRVNVSNGLIANQYLAYCRSISPACFPLLHLSGWSLPYIQG